MISNVKVVGNKATVILSGDTDGAAGAARAAGMGVGFYADSKEAFSALEKIAVIEPEFDKKEQYLEAYERWKRRLNLLM